MVWPVAALTPSSIRVGQDASGDRRETSRRDRDCGDNDARRHSGAILRHRIGCPFGLNFEATVVGHNDRSNHAAIKLSELHVADLDILGGFNPYLIRMNLIPVPLTARPGASATARSYRLHEERPATYVLIVVALVDAWLTRLSNGPAEK